MTLASMVPMILLMLMGRRAAPPPPWPGERPQQRPRPQHPHGRTVSRPPKRPASGHLPGFISPDDISPILTAMPVGPGVPVRTRPTPRPRNQRPLPTPVRRPVDDYPIRSPGLPTHPRDQGPPPGVPDSVLHPPPPHFDLPDIPDGIEIPPEVQIDPIEHAPPAHEPEPEHEEEAEKIVVVRKGEGLSQVAQRLGRPGGLADVRTLRAANIPHGPENDWESTKTGNLTIPGQPNRGLQPGDTLFVPHDWL